MPKNVMSVEQVPNKFRYSIYNVLSLIPRVRLILESFQEGHLIL